ncbi:hypothetical protein [Tenacibaculum amylolyticum]|uniref:hypothetical protein n=1 Tax=Tenacibaculum amylolyticum TaxID=104269 RepID=UPI003894014C
MKKILFLIMIATMVIGCNKNEELIQDVENQSTLEERSTLERKGMLNFRSIEGLQSFIKERSKPDFDHLKEARSFSERRVYNPLLLVYNLKEKEMKSLGIDEREVPSVASDDDMFLLLLNQDGEMGVGDKIVRVDGDFVFTYVDGSAKDIDSFLEKYKSGNIRISRGKTIDFSKNLTVYMHNNKTETVESDSRGVTSFRFFSGDYRMKARQFDEYWYVYSSIGASTKVQKRSRFLWWTTWGAVYAHNRLEYNATYRVNFNTQGLPPAIRKANGFKYPYSLQARAVYSWNVGFPASEKYEPMEGETKHWAHWYTTPVNTVSLTLNY